MGFWEGKCFMCFFWGTLISIVSISTTSEIKEQKRLKRIEQIKTQYRDTLN